MYVLAEAELGGADSASGASEAPDQAHDSVRFVQRRSLSRLGRIRAFAHRGLTTTVVYLVLLGAVVVAYAFWILPDTAVPQPRPSYIEIDFSPGHPARSPITVTITLERDRFDISNDKGMSLNLDLSGPDLAHPGWSLYMTMPKGVQLNLPTTGQVGRYQSSATEDTVVLKPGPQEGQRYSPRLLWKDLHSGPMQVHDANMAAWLPQVAIDNWASSGSNGTPSVPEPQMRVTREVIPFGDFTYLGGQPP